MLLVGVFNINIITCILSSLGVILCGGYSLWLYNRIIFGNLKIAYTYKFNDLNIREFFILFPLLINIFLIGIFPGFFLNFFNFSISNLLILNL
jgi:NADH-quinone oxidoreductase subunit M